MTPRQRAEALRTELLLTAPPMTMRERLELLANPPPMPKKVILPPLDTHEQQLKRLEKGSPLWKACKQFLKEHGRG